MSRPESIDAIRLRSVKEKYAPPALVLRLAAVGDIAFLTICKYDENGHQTNEDEMAEIDVDLDALYDALTSIRNDAWRSAQKRPL